MKLLRPLWLTLLFIAACAPPAPAATPAPTMPPPTATATAVPLPTIPTTTRYTYEIVNSYPHDSTAFTQGLQWKDGALYEGTGLYGQSDLRQVALEDGSTIQEVDIPPEYFGEGIVIFEDKIYQLTWQSHTGFVYDQENFELLESFNYATEGWGITHDGQRLIMSDGTNNIYFWDPETLEPVGSIQVHDANGAVVNINELEYIDGEIYANIWQTNRIARIDPQTGWVTGWIDLSGLLPDALRTELSDPGNAVLNGIAYDQENGRIFVTGKLWPQLYEINIIEE